MVYGARQVGKTYIIKEFGEQEYDRLVYVNCYKNDLAQNLFSDNADIDRILVGLSSMAHKTIVPGKTPSSMAQSGREHAPKTSK